MEFASATEAGTPLAAWCVDARTWHVFSEASNDVAPPSREHVRKLGFVILQSFWFVFGVEQKVVDATPLARASVDVGAFDLQLRTPKKHGLCIATFRAAAFLSSAEWVDGGIWIDPDHFAEERYAKSLKTKAFCVTRATARNEVPSSLRRVLRCLIFGRKRCA